jgi:hypothetical protein
MNVKISSKGSPPMKYPVFLDVEASGLSDESYPIEVAWNNEDGVVSSFLVKISLVPEWTHWDPNAEKLHGITREMLEEGGIAPGAACNVLRTELRGMTVHSDSTMFDQFWLHRLFNAGANCPSPVRLTDLCGVDAIVLAAGRKIAVPMKAKAKAETGGAHRAKNDVRALMRFYELAEEARKEWKQCQN